MDGMTPQQGIAKMRRDQPRNPLAMWICDLLEERLRSAPQESEPFDRKAYMRQYMKDWRARKRTERERTR